MEHKKGRTPKAPPLVQFNTLENAMAGDIERVFTAAFEYICGDVRLPSVRHKCTTWRADFQPSRSSPPRIMAKQPKVRSTQQAESFRFEQRVDKAIIRGRSENEEFRFRLDVESVVRLSYQNGTAKLLNIPGAAAFVATGSNRGANDIFSVVYCATTSTESNGCIFTVCDVLAYDASQHPLVQRGRVVC